MKKIITFICKGFIVFIFLYFYKNKLTFHSYGMGNSEMGKNEKLTMEESLDKIVSEMCYLNLMKKYPDQYRYSDQLQVKDEYDKLFEQARVLLKSGVNLQTIRHYHSNVLSHAHTLELFDLVEEMIPYLNLSDGMSAAFHPYEIAPLLVVLYQYSDIRIRQGYSNPESLFQMYLKHAPVTEKRVFNKYLKTGVVFKFEHGFDISEKSPYQIAKQLEAKEIIPQEYDIRYDNVIDAYALKYNIPTGIIDLIKEFYF